MAILLPHRLLDPENDAILVIESHGGEPHAVITENRTYDFFLTAESGTIYNNSGSGLRGRTYCPGRLVRGPEADASIWVAEGITLVDDQGAELSDEALREYGYVRGEEPATNLFDGANEDQAVYCEITRKWWTYEEPSRFLRYLEHAGVWAGVGATDEIKPARVRQSLAELTLLMGSGLTRKLMSALLAINETCREIEVEHDGYQDKLSLTFKLGDFTHTFTFKAPEDIMPKLEAGIAWLETVDGKRAYGAAIDAHNMLLESVLALEFVRAAIRGTPVPPSMRKLWKAVRRQAVMAGRRNGAELVQAFITTIKPARKS